MSLAAPFTLPAPAKLNLFLHVVGRRTDGYHNLQTVFQFLDYGDSLTFTPTYDPGVQLTTPLANVTAQNNLILRAAHVLYETYQPSGPGVHISLIKRLPMGGGLGGGSSNAATTLIALNHLWDLQIPLPALMQLGLNLGADVPVFLSGQAAFAQSKGEDLQPITLPEPWFLVLTPSCVVETARIFSDSRLTRDTPSLTIGDFLAGQGHNDCEPVTRALYPDVGAALDWLQQYGIARMTGTGASVFASFNSQAEAEAVLRQRPSKVQGFVAKGCNTSPLHIAATWLKTTRNS